MNNNLNNVFLEGDLKVEPTNGSRENKSIQEIVDSIVNTQLLYGGCLGSDYKLKDYPNGATGFHYKIDAKDVISKASFVYDLALFYIKSEFVGSSKMADALDYFEQKYACINPANYREIKQFVRRRLDDETLSNTYTIYVHDDGQIDIDETDLAKANAMKFVLSTVLGSGVVQVDSNCVKSSSNLEDSSMLEISFGELFDEHPYAYTACKRLLAMFAANLDSADKAVNAFDELFKPYCPYEQ